MCEGVGVHEGVGGLVCVCACVHACVGEYVCVCMHVYECVCICVCVSMYIVEFNFCFLADIFKLVPGSKNNSCKVRDQQGKEDNSCSGRVVREMAIL